MNILTRMRHFLERRATKMTGLSPQTPDYWVNKLFGGGGASTAGVDVNEDSALTASAFFCGVSLIADAVKSMPISVLERVDAQTRTEVVDHPAWRLLRVRPNPFVTPSRFKWFMTACKIVWGNGYAEIERTPGGAPINLWPIHPSRVVPMRNDAGDVFYRVSQDRGADVMVPARDMFHIMGYSKDGLVGQSVIRFGAESMGLAIATDRSAATFFGSGSQLAGVLMFPAELSKQASKRLGEEWDQQAQGFHNHHTTVLLKEGLEYKAIGVPPGDAQLIESRMFSITEWARWLKIPPHKLKDLSNAHLKNIEEQNTEYFTDAILPEIIDFEEQCDAKLLAEAERGTLSCKFNDHAILRANIDTQTSHFTAMLDRGVYTINMVLGMLNKNGMGPEGDIHYIQGQMMQVGVKPKPVVPPNQGSDDDGSDDDTVDERSLRPIVRDAFGRIAHKEIDRLRRGMKQCSGDVGEYRAWVHDFYKKYETFVAQTLASVREVVGGDRLDGIEARYVKASRTELLVAMTEAGAGEEYGAVNDLLNDWGMTRADTACDALFGSLNDENRKQSMVSKAGAA